MLDSQELYEKSFGYQMVEGLHKQVLIYLSSNFYLLILGLQGFYLLILGSKYILYQMVEGLREQVLKSLIVAIFFC